MWETGEKGECVLVFWPCSVNGNMPAFLQLCRSSSGRRVSGLCRGRRWSPRAWRRWCRRNPPPPPRASGTSPPLRRCPHTGNRQTVNLFLVRSSQWRHTEGRVTSSKDSQPQSNRGSITFIVAFKLWKYPNIKNLIFSWTMTTPWKTSVCPHRPRWWRIVKVILSYDLITGEGGGCVSTLKLPYD